MASGHVNRANRPNTWPLRPMLQSEDSPCQAGAVRCCRFTMSAVRSGVWAEPDYMCSLRAFRILTHNRHLCARD
jgi:hypothetical protein